VIQLVLATDRHTVRALDAHGRETWRGQPERGCDRVWGWSPATGGTWIACVAFGAVTLYRATPATPRRTLRVSGTVWCAGETISARVLVGGTKVATGHYDLEVVEDDELMIQTDEDRNTACAPLHRRVDVPPNATSVEVDLTLVEQMFSFDGL
jgi:hypothetical protein